MDRISKTRALPSIMTRISFSSLILHGPSWVLFCLALCLAWESHAQTPTAPAPSLVANGDFEQLASVQNLWDGVDGGNNLRTWTYSNVITEEGGSPANVNFPCSPQFVDMDADGLKDLVVGDPSGFIWIYKNRGEKGNPKFTTAEFIPSYYGGATKIWAGDFSGDRRVDLVVGTAFGHVIYVPNIGSPQKWKFTHEMAKPRYCWPGYVHQGFDIPYLTLGKEVMLFGTYMAPYVYDWDKDNKKDLILGDGTYSANSVWLLRNTGSNQNPKFEPDEKHYLAYGEGREQLVPTICDINGDDLPDIIVADRQGYINLYLNKKDLPKDTPKPAFGSLVSLKMDHAPPVIPWNKHLQLGTQEKFPGPLAVSACDWNDDDKIDLLLGYPDGTMAVSINTGTKTEPKFDAPKTITGLDTEKDFPSPSGWSYSHSGVCNSCFTVRALTEDKMSNGELVKPKSGKYLCKFAYEHDYPGYIVSSHFNYAPTLAREGWMIGGRSISTSTGNLTIGKKYEVSAWVRGADVNPVWVIYQHVAIRTNRKNRAAVASYSVEAPVSVNEGQWTRFSKTFICPGPDKNQRIKASNDQINFGFYFGFPATSLKAYCYIDDVRIEESKTIGGLATTPPPTPSK